MKILKQIYKKFERGIFASFDKLEQLMNI